MFKRVLLLLIVMSYHYADAQESILKVGDLREFKSAFKEEIEVFKSLKFNINGRTFCIKDSLKITFPVNDKQFDTIRYSYILKGKEYKDMAIAKFKQNEEYKLWPCVCCGIFGISTNKPERGVVRFKNTSKKKFIGITGDFDYEVIEPKSLSKYYFSSISMNCGYTPNELSIYDFNFKNNLDEALDKLGDEKYAVNFLYISGEKITIEYLDKGNSKVTFDGYLEEGEVVKYFKKYE
ncbi:hypothetical protein ABGT15_12335 [Flavobacterium enshiense]|uniref:hypothetical protein n=1 Tax=Flavobacterium enshiense TaxID=1341165 RepID=UPI00345C7653